MDQKTAIIKEAITQKYKSVRAFAREAGIPYTTLISALERGIGGTAVETVVRMCELLDLDLGTLWPETKACGQLLSPHAMEIARRYDELTVHGKKLVQTILDFELTNQPAARARLPLFELPSNEKKGLVHLRYYPTAVSAGTGEPLDNASYTEFIEAPLNDLTKETSFVLRVKGDSMEPVYFEGDRILIREESEIAVGEVGIFVVNGEGYVKKKGTEGLESLNSKYKTIHITEFDECRCIGRVLGKLS